MKHDRLTMPQWQLVRKRSRRDVVRDGLIAAGSLATAPWLMQP